MLNRKTFVLGLSVAFILGGIVSGYIVRARMTDNVNNASMDMSIQSNAIDVKTLVTVLTDIKNGNARSVVETLELELNRKIIGLHEDPSYSVKTNILVKNAITGARSYRATYPYKSNIGNTDELVERKLKGI